MSLEDVAKLISPKAPGTTLRLLEFIGSRTVARDDLKRELGLDEKAFEYYITRLKRLHLLETTRSGGKAFYRLDPSGFRSRFITVYVDPLKELTSEKRKR